LITDVVRGKRQSYRYGALRLTKAGRPYERGGGTCLTPSTRIRIEKCRDGLPDDTLRLCTMLQSRAREILEQARDHGATEHLLKRVQERRAVTVF